MNQAQPTSPTEFSSGHRWAIGVNVTVVVVVAAALLVAVNWFSSLVYSRHDVARFANYGLSERTKRALDSYPDPIQMWVLYAPASEDPRQEEYAGRLQDYCDELLRYAPHLSVTYVTSESQRDKLVNQISGTFGGEAEAHKQALARFETLRQELTQDLQARLQQGTALTSADTWLADFPLFTNVLGLLKNDAEALKKAAEEISELAPAGGIPQYGEAVSKAKQTLTDLKSHFGVINERMSELAALADETANPASAHLTMLREVAAEAKQAVALLREAVGPKDAELPADPSGVLSALKDRSEEVSRRLEGLVRKVDGFAAKFPVVKQHNNWKAPVRMGPFNAQMEVADVLDQAGQSLQQIRLALLSILDRKDPAELQKALVNVRESVSGLEQNAAACERLLIGLAERLAQVDEASKALLAASRNKGYLAEKAAAVEEVAKALEDLPELKLGSVADQIKEQNVVVIEANGKIRVVGFSEVWPIRESVGGPAARSEEPARTFNGDSALSSAILALTQKAPFATVVLVSYEPPPPPQRGPFSPPPPESWIPSRMTAPLRQRLETANFKVKEWNLATGDECPEPEEGTENVYVLLPPAPPQQQNIFSQQQPPPQSFGEEHRKKIRDLLDKDARAIFLATWELTSSGPFGGGPMVPPYGYRQLLEDDWGILVDNTQRLVWIEPDRQKPNTFMVVPRKFQHLPAIGFLDHPIGAPMQGTRFLINDACPLRVKKELPAGVTVQSVLRLPDRENYIAADLPQIIQLIDQVRNPRSEGKVTLRDMPASGPFDLMVAAERRDGEKMRGRIVVMGFGATLRGDYLENPVMAEGETLRLDPPPTEGVDLFVNSLYWLQGRPEWIARGPGAVPRIRPIEAGSRTGLRVFVWGMWPALVLAPGLLLWWIRRR